MGAAIKRVETLPPTLIRGASQLHALEPRDEVQSLFTTSCETGEFFPCQGESWLIPPRRNVLRAFPKVRGSLHDHSVCFGQLLQIKRA